MPILTPTHSEHAGLPAALAAFLGALGVAAGAFGAHALEAHLVAIDRVDTWQTAAFYQLIHAVLALIAALHGQRLAAWLLLGGILVFSGSLYLLCAFPSQSWFGAITPLGGLAFIAAWLLLAWKFIRN